MVDVVVAPIIRWMHCLSPLHNSTIRPSFMPKGRHRGRTKSNKQLTSISSEINPNEPTQPAFTSLGKTSPLLTLLFESKIAQHAALSRIEAFYESTRDTQVYLTLDQAKAERQCQHYEAFNFPIDAVGQWLASMEQKHYPEGKASVENGKEDVTSSESDSHWWKAHCNNQEYHLLTYLDTLGVFEEDQSMVAPPIYLISTISSKQASLRHERLHFLYYISPSYRNIVKEQYDSLSTKSLKIIENDLAMRKYSSHVWIDEFQAYVSEDAGEFGNSVKQDCQEISQTLRNHQAKILNELNFG